MDVLFNEDRWNQLYNCSRYPVEQIPIEQRKNVLLGVIILILFVIFEFLYAICLYAMSSLLSKSSSYKIMFTLGIAEMICLLNSGLITGIFAIQGYVFCSAPVFMYCIGIKGLFDWDLTTALQVLLAFERCMEQLAPRLAEQLFGQKRIYIWFGIIFVYSTFFGIFTMPTLFTSVLFLWDYDPYFGYRSIQQRMEEGLYVNHHDEIHNASLAIVIPALYIVFFICLSFQWRETINFNESQQKLRRSFLCDRSIINCQKVFIQVFFISMLLFIYVINFYISVWVEVPTFMIVLNQFLWVAIDGLPPVIYLCMNKMIRNRLLQFVKSLKPNQSTRVLPMVTGTATPGKTMANGISVKMAWNDQRRKSSVRNLI